MLPWIVFAVAQLLLGILWWYVSLWIAVGLLGVENLSGTIVWSIFCTLVMISLFVGAVVVSSRRSDTAETS